jgi:hypothetical protein
VVCFGAASGLLILNRCIETKPAQFAGKRIALSKFHATAAELTRRCASSRFVHTTTFTDAMRAYHDLGGTPAGPIDAAEHELQLWEKRVEALLVLLTRKKILRMDENRRGLESLGNETYFALSYAERRMLSVSNNLILKGVITVEELAARIADIEGRAEPLP